VKTAKVLNPEGFDIGRKRDTYYIGLPPHSAEIYDL